MGFWCYQDPSWQVDGFAMRPDEDKPGFFNNAPDDAEASGAATQPVHS